MAVLEFDVKLLKRELQKNRSQNVDKVKSMIYLDIIRMQIKHPHNVTFLLLISFHNYFLYYTLYQTDLKNRKNNKIFYWCIINPHSGLLILNQAPIMQTSGLPDFRSLDNCRVLDIPFVIFDGSSSTLKATVLIAFQYQNMHHMSR